MHPANLQIEGLLVAFAALNRALVEKGRFTVEEIDTLLHMAESAATSEERMAEELSPAQRDAVCFPIRFLRLANQLAPDPEALSFSALARGVGMSKAPYNDQM